MARNIDHRSPADRESPRAAQEVCVDTQRYTLQAIAPAHVGKAAVTRCGIQAGIRTIPLRSDRAHVRRFGTFSALASVKLDFLAFLERAETIRSDVGIVDEVVSAPVLRGDKPIPFLIIEPFNSTSSQRILPSGFQTGVVRKIPPRDDGADAGGRTSIPANRSVVKQIA